jgi:hypothetical protein
MAQTSSDRGFQFYKKDAQIKTEKIDRMIHPFDHQ